MSKLDKLIQKGLQNMVTLRADIKRDILKNK